MLDHERKLKSAALIVLHSILKNKKKSSRQDRRWWITHLCRQREARPNLMDHLQFNKTTGQFKNFIRMASEDLEFLLSKIGPKIMKKDTTMRNAVSVDKRLAVTLRFLATGDCYTSLQYTFLISKQLISLIVPEVCQASTYRSSEDIC